MGLTESKNADLSKIVLVQDDSDSDPYEMSIGDILKMDGIENPDSKTSEDIELSDGRPANISFVGGHWCGYLKGSSDDFKSEYDPHGGITGGGDDTFGFDCAHFTDINLMTAMLFQAIGSSSSGTVSTYKTKAFVISELEKWKPV
mgnify:CR=1 FL=1